MSTCLIICDMFGVNCTQELALNDLPAKITNFVNRSKIEHIISTKFRNNTSSALYTLGINTEIGTEEQTKLVEVIEDMSEQIFERDTFTCLTDEVWNYIKENDITTVYLVGIGTETCIYKSALDFVERHISVYIPVDLCGSTDGDLTNISGMLALIAALGEKRIVVADENETIY